MRQLVIDYFNNEAESGDIARHYEWFMNAGTTVHRIVAQIASKQLFTMEDDDKLTVAIRQYIDEMDDAEGNV